MPLTTIYGYADAPTSALLGNASLGWTTLAAGLAPSATAVTVASASGFPTALEFDVLVGLRDVTTGIWSNAENLHVTITAGTSWTVTRGDPSLTHAIGESVSAVLTANGVKHNPGALTTSGDLPYLNSSGRMDRLAAPADGTYGFAWSSGVPSWSAIVAPTFSGALAATQVAFGTGADVIGGSADLIWADTTKTLTIGDSTGTGFAYGSRLNVIQVSASAEPYDVAPQVQAAVWTPSADTLSHPAYIVQNIFEVGGTHTIFAAATLLSIVDMNDAVSVTTDVSGQFASVNWNGVGTAPLLIGHRGQVQTYAGTVERAIAVNGWIGLYGGDVGQAVSFNAQPPNAGFAVRAGGVNAGYFCENWTGEGANTYAFWYNGTGTNAGVWRINQLGIVAYYNPAFATYTPGAADFERVRTEWIANVATIGTEAGGTGTLRVLNLVGSDVQANGVTIATQTYVNGQGFVTATSSTAFTNKSGNISQWTNDASYTTLAAVAGVGYLTSVTAHNLLSTTHGDTLADTVVRGDLLIGNSTPKWARLAKPSVLSGLSHDGTDVSWVTATGTGAPVRAASPTFTGAPLSTTPTVGDNTTKIATTAYVLAAVAAGTTGVTSITGTANQITASAATGAVTLSIPTNPVFSGTALTFPGLLSIVSGKTATINTSLTFDGTDSTTMTFPTTSATIARTDAANTFTGHQTIEGVTSTGATGTGNFVFDGTPTLVTPVLGAATGTSVVLTGVTSTATSGTVTVNSLSGTANPSSTSTLVYQTLKIAPTINFSAGTPGAGSYEALKIAVVETALPTGTNYLIRASAGAAGTTDKFLVKNDGTITTTGSIQPSSNGVGGLGTNSLQWANAYIQDIVALGTMYIGGLTSPPQIQRDGAYILSIRNGTNAQKVRLFNTHTTIGTAGEWWKQDWITTANQFRMGTVKGTSTGTAEVASWDYGGLEASPSAAITVPITSGNIVFGGGITLPGGATFLTTNTGLTDGAGVGLGTLGTAPAAGNPTKWIGINDNGTTRYIPAW